MSFLPQDYEQPQGGGRYTKLKQGETRLRIISNSIIGWEGWTPENKPVRVRMDHKEQLARMTLKDKPRHFWAFLVWNYTTQQIEIFQIHQKKIQDGILTLYHSDDDWGDPKSFDILISRVGEGLDTEYSVNGGRKSQMDDPQKVKKMYHDSPCDINRLYEGDDPWELSEDAKLACIAEFDQNFDDLPF